MGKCLLTPEIAAGTLIFDSIRQFGRKETGCQHIFFFPHFIASSATPWLVFDKAVCQGFNRRTGVSAGRQRRNYGSSSLMEYLARVWANKTRMAVCGNEDSLIGIFSGLIPEGESKALKKKKCWEPEHAHTQHYHPLPKKLDNYHLYF